MERVAQRVVSPQHPATAEDVGLLVHEIAARYAQVPALVLVTKHAQSNAGIVNGEAFKAYQKQGVELDAQFKIAVTELEQKYIPDTLKGHKTRWNLEYKTAELKVDILCNCAIEGIE